MSTAAGSPVLAGSSHVPRLLLLLHLFKLAGRCELSGRDCEQPPQVLAIVAVRDPSPFLEESLLHLFASFATAGHVTAEVHLRSRRALDLLRALWPRLRPAVVRLRLVSSGGRVWIVDRAVRSCRAALCDFVFLVDAVAHLRHRHALSLLLSHRQEAVAPMMRSPDGHWTARLRRPGDHWGRGMFPARRLSPLCVLLARLTLRSSASSLPRLLQLLGNSDRAFASTELAFGNVMLRGSNAVDRLHPELSHVVINLREWSERYLHPSYRSHVRHRRFEQPCPEIYWFPLFSLRFCQELIEEAEGFGRWSVGDGSDSSRTARDPRRVHVKIDEYAATDIRLWQMDLMAEMMFVIMKFVSPVRRLLFPEDVDTFYYSSSFVSRYVMGKQESLKAHIDDGELSINVALNAYGKDYLGGGTRFVFHNCTVRSSRRGWALLHKNGLIDKFHEGLKLLSGRRYLFVGFLRSRVFPKLRGLSVQEVWRSFYELNTCYDEAALSKLFEKALEQSYEAD